MNIDQATQLVGKLDSQIQDDSIKSAFSNNQSNGNLDAMDAQSFLCDLNLGISTDWKWDPEDLLGHIKKIIADFEYFVKKSDFNDDDETWSVVLDLYSQEDIHIETELDSIGEFIDVINEAIDRHTDSQFESFFTDGDSFFYLLLPNGVVLTTEETEKIEFSLF